MKGGLAQINSTVGDFPANAKRIIAAYREALDEGAELVLVPEMALVGYPPRDLVFKSGVVDKCLQGLDYLKGEIGEVPLVVGYVYARCRRYDDQMVMTVSQVQSSSPCFPSQMLLFCVLEKHQIQ